MLLRDHAVTDRKAKSCSLTSRLGCKEGGKNFIQQLRRNARSIVANAHFKAIA